jgi:hypothetical protein
VNVTIEDGNGRIIEQTINHGDGTGTRTVYHDDGTETVEQVTGLPVEPPIEKVRRTLEERLANGLRSNKEYLNLDKPTAAQTNQQIRRLTRQLSALIRLAMQQLDEED